MKKYILISVLLFACSKKKDNTPQVTTIKVSAKMKYVAGVQSYNWQAEIDFSNSITNVSGVNTIRFTTYRGQTWWGKQELTFAWNIPLNTYTPFIQQNTTYTNLDFDKVDSVEVVKTNSNSALYIFQ